MEGPIFILELDKNLGASLELKIFSIGWIKIFKMSHADWNSKIKKGPSTVEVPQVLSKLNTVYHVLG